MCSSDLHQEESLRMNDLLTEGYAHHGTAGFTFEQYKEDLRFDTFLSAQEAIDKGLADQIITKREEK